jgi:hypothetical protein
LTRSTQLIKLAVIVVFLGLILSAFLSGTNTFADSLRGYEIGFQFLEGASYNTLNYPSAANSAYSYYVSWWSPAQWTMPYLLWKIFGSDSIQLVQFILISLSLLIALLGYHRLFKIHFGVSAITYFSLLILVSHPLFYWQTLMYMGGDLFLLAITPWFIVFLSSRLEKLAASDAFYFLLFGILGVFIKTSFLLLIAAGGIYLFFRISGNLKSKIRSTWMIALTAFALLLIAKVFFIGPNETPSSAIDSEGYYGVPNTYSSDVSYPLGSPIGALSHATKYAQQLEASQDSNSMFSEIIKWGSVALFCVFLLTWKDESKRYHHILLYFAVPFLVFFVPFGLMDKAISYEFRHYAPILFLFIPPFIQCLSSFMKRAMLYSLLVIFIAFNAYIFSADYQFLNANTSYFKSFKMTSEEVIPYKLLGEWDKNHSNGICLIEEYWAPSLAVRENDKMILREEGNNLFLVSGMELDHPDKMKDLDLLNSYDFILVVGKEGNSTDLFRFTQHFEEIRSGKSGQFEWKEYRTR